MQNTGWRSGRRTAVLVVLAAMGPGLAIPVDAAAQEWPSPAWETDEWTTSSLELTAYTGAIFPMSSLGSQGDTLQAELSTRPTFAASLEYWFGGGFGLGLSGGLSSPDLTLTTADAEEGTQERTELGSADFLHAEALILWRPEFSGSAEGLLPYFGAGAGIRRLGFESGSGFEDTTDPIFVLNTGAQVRLSDAVHFRLDVRDLISSFEGGPFENSDMQHDLFAQVGFGIGL